MTCFSKYHQTPVKQYTDASDKGDWSSLDCVMWRVPRASPLSAPGTILNYLMWWTCGVILCWWC